MPCGAPSSYKMSFSFSLKKSSAAKPAAGARPLAAAAAPAAAAAAPAAGGPRAPLDVFKQALDEEAEAAEHLLQQQKKGNKIPRLTLDHFSRKNNIQEKEIINNLLQQDPQALSYDEVYEQVSSTAAKEQQQKAQSHRIYLGYTKDIQEKINKDRQTADILAAEAEGALRGAPQSGGGGPSEWGGTTTE